MDIEITPHPLTADITRVGIAGRIDSYTVERVTEELQSLIRIGSNRIVCNLAAVEFIAGPGLKAFQKLIEQARAQGGGDLKLCALQPAVGKTVELAGFNRIADLYDCEERALQAFGVPGIVLPSDATLKPGSTDAFGHTVVLNRPQEPSRFAAAQATCILPSPTAASQPQDGGKTLIVPRMPVGGTNPRAAPPPRPPQAPGFEPLRMWIPCDGFHCPCLSRGVGFLSDLMQADAPKAERLGTALEEVVRAAVSACPADAVIGVEISWMGRLLSARVIVPVAGFCLYEHLRPTTDAAPGTPEGAERWLRNLAGYVDIGSGAGEVQITLAPLDTDDSGS